MIEFLMNESLMPIMSFVTPLLIILVGYLASGYMKKLDKKFEEIDARFKDQQNKLDTLTVNFASSSATSSSERSHADQDLQELKQALAKLDAKMETMLKAQLSCPARNNYLRNRGGE